MLNGGLREEEKKNRKKTKGMLAMEREAREKEAAANPNANGEASKSLASKKGKEKEKEAEVAWTPERSSTPFVAIRRRFAFSSALKRMSSVGTVYLPSGPAGGAGKGKSVCLPSFARRQCS